MEGCFIKMKGESCEIRVRWVSGTAELGARSVLKTSFVLVSVGAESKKRFWV